MIYIEQYTPKMLGYYHVNLSIVNVKLYDHGGGPYGELWNGT